MIKTAKLLVERKSPPKFSGDQKMMISIARRKGQLLLMIARKSDRTRRLSSSISRATSKDLKSLNNRRLAQQEVVKTDWERRLLWMKPKIFLSSLKPQHKRSSVKKQKRDDKAVDFRRRLALRL